MVRRAVLLVATVAVAACGSDELSGDDPVAWLTAQHAVATYCVDGTVQEQTIDGATDDDRYAAALDQLVDLYRAQPDASIDDVSLRRDLTDTANNLDNCDPGAARRLDRVLDEDG